MANKRKASTTPLRRSTRSSAVHEDIGSPEPESPRKRVKESRASSTKDADAAAVTFVKQEENGDESKLEDSNSLKADKKQDSNGQTGKAQSRSRRVKKEPSSPKKVTKGEVPSPRRAKQEQSSPAKVKKEQTSPRKVKKQEEESQDDADDVEDEDKENVNGEETIKSKKTKKPAADLAAQKLKKLTSFVTSPYPNFAHPTAAECKKVVDLLSSLHGPAIRPTGRPIDDTSLGANCGAVPSVIDALVRTILSQNTTSKNSTAAKRSLDATFGKGNWKAVDAASDADVEEAIRVGGLAPSKTRTIKNVLRTAKESYGEFSLDHLHGVSNDDAMRELISFKGVGPKTASCVLLFCMARDSFAVDTHVFRLSKSLGWVPAKAGREETYGHLDATIPGEYKYPLHTLLITHGKRCGRCSAHRKSGLLPANECPLLGISKTLKEEDLKMDTDEDDDGNDDDAPEVDEQVKSLVAKVEDAARQEQRNEDGMAEE